MKLLILNQRDIDNRANEIINYCILNMQLRDICNWHCDISIPNDIEYYYLLRDAIVNNKLNSDYEFIVSNIIDEKKHFVLMLDVELKNKKLIKM